MSQTDLLQDIYNNFFIEIEGKRVAIPYRRNEVGSLQNIGPEFQGKSSPEVIRAKLLELSREENFDLEQASVEEIRKFMREHKLGIDCSGFIYRVLNEYLKQIQSKSLQDVGFEHVGRTNIAKLTSDEFAVRLNSVDLALPGDIIKFESGEDVLHGVLVLNNDAGIITYAHSSGETKIDGVHSDQIIDGKFPEDLEVFKYDEKKGDGLYRLKALI